MIEELVARFQDRLNAEGGVGVSRMFDLPAFAVSNHHTIIGEDYETIAACVDKVLADFPGESQPKVRLVVENTMTVAPTLFITQISKSVRSDVATMHMDPWTEHWIVRLTPVGPKLAGMLNFFGNRVDVAALGTPKSVERRAKSIDEFTANYRIGIETLDLGMIGQSLEFPAIAVMADYTRMIPDFATCLQFADHLRNQTQDAGLKITHAKSRAPIAVGADLIMIPVDLDIRNISENKAIQIEQCLVLYVGDDGISCVAVFNALDGTLARLAQAEVR